MTAASGELLVIRDLVVERPGVRLLDSVALSIGKGETLSLVGESGCGKSLSALAILGLLPEGVRHARGEILFEDEDLARASPRRLRQIRGKSIGLVMQDPMSSLDPVLQIGAQMEEAIRTHLPLSARQARGRALELLDLAGVPEPLRRYGQYPHQLSGGLRQRVSIATAISCTPRLLIADEPTTALDVTTQVQVLDLLDRLRRELSMALLLITHDLSIVARRADKVCVMYAGRVVERAGVDDFFAHPRHPYSKGLLHSSLGAGTPLHHRFDRLPEITGSIASAAGQSGCPFAPRCDQAEAACGKTLSWPGTTDSRDHFSACLHPNPEESA
ncbi:ABC transporter ATP-binding protein [Telmatospirillum siberiense]|uniref:Dipeptide ABC transporter ATP-binding protein DppD n=1 Tax=Telmatospirillum siberiense TaxID=382514 RepID=A0A2N3PQ15_9PROT|nr:ABC transporter ATP-binding protein [Telmatospirillum siberiense]PKU22495.1 dipeptide ABC transporter ATP-binding protein DppD [Telmatospirillum siberiense]